MPATKVTDSLVENVSDFPDVAEQPKHAPVSSSKVESKDTEPQAVSDPQSKDAIKMNIVKTDLDLSTGTQRDSHSLVDNVSQFDDVSSQPKHIVKEDPQVEEEAPQI